MRSAHPSSMTANSKRTSTDPVAIVLQGDPTERIDRVRLAHVLLDAGLTRTEIATRLGVSRATVRDYLRRPRDSRVRSPGTCPDCGEQTSRPGRRCGPCVTERSRLWTAESAVEVIAVWEGPLTLAQLDHPTDQVRHAQTARRLPSGRTARRTVSAKPYSM